MLFKFRILVITILLLFIAAHLAHAGNDDIKKGWNSFYKNDIAEARKHFVTASNDPASKTEANLLLSMLASIDKTQPEAFNYFMEFYENAENADPYLFALWLTPGVNNGYSIKTDEQIEFLESLIENENINGSIKSMAYDMLGRSYDMIGEFEDADEYFSKSGSITEWQLLGEFENISASGFDKDWLPVKHPEKDFVFTNKRNAPVKWFDFDKRRVGKWIDLTHHFHYSNSIIFAQTFCESPSEQIVQLRIGTSGSLKAWVNDHLVYSEPEERNNGIDTYITTIKLNKGFNRLLLQIGESEVNRSNFLCRLTDEKANNIENLNFHYNISDPISGYDRNYDFEGEYIPVFAELYFENKIKSEPENMLNYLLLTETYMRNDKTYEARNVIRNAQKLAPECSYLLWQMIQVYTRDDNRTSLSIALEKMKDIDPYNPLSLELLFNEEFGKENYEEAKNIIKSFEKVWGATSKNVLSKKIQVAAAEKKNEEIKNLVSDAYERYPNDYNFVYMIYLLEKQNKNNDRAIRYIRDYLEDRFSTDAVQILAEYYFDKDRTSDGFEQMERLIEYSPTAPGYYNRIAKLYFMIRDYDAALINFGKCSEIAPYIGKYYGDIGQTYEEMNLKDKAIDAYKKCILYEPYNYDTRKKLRKITEKKEIFEYYTKPDFDEIFKNAPSAEEYPEDNSLILHDEVQRVVYSGSASEEKHYLMAKVFNVSGIDEWKEFNVPANRSQKYIIEKAEVYKKNGSKLKAETNRTHIVFTSLEVGDVILVVFKMENYQYGKLRNHFWDKHYFSHYYPIQKSIYSLLVGQDIKFEYKAVNSDLKPEIEKSDGFLKYTWERNNQASIKYESYMPSLADVGEVLHISSFPDWDYISNWYSDLSRSKAKADFEVKELIKELFKDSTNLSEKEKVKVIYDYIVKNIRYSYISFRQSGMIPQKASKTINTRIGDCKDVSTLFVTLCREIGVDSKLVLVGTRSNGKLNMALPSIDFDHCIANVNMDGEEYYVELTNDYNPFSTIFYSLKNSIALKISEEEQDNKPLYLNPPTRVSNAVIRRGDITFEGEKMIVKKHTSKTGGRAAGMRSNYRDKGKKAREKDMQEAISSEYPIIKLTHLEFDNNLYSTDDTISYKYFYEVGNVFTAITDLLLLKLPFADIQLPMDFLSDEKRKYPVDFWKYSGNDLETEVINIHIPKGKKLAEIPSNENFTCPIADYKLEFQLKGEVLIAKREMKYKDDEVPMSRYKEFSKFFENVIKADSKQIAFK